MDVRLPLCALLLTTILLASCATVEEVEPIAPREWPQEEKNTPSQTEKTPDAAEAGDASGTPEAVESSETTKAPEKKEEEQNEAGPLPPPAQPFPRGVTLVTEGNRPLRRAGDFDGDGHLDVAFLGVRGSEVTAAFLQDEQRLYASPEAERVDAFALLRLAGGESLILPVGKLLLLAEFDTLSLTPDREQPKGELLYLRLETREQQRHLLVSVNPAGPKLQRYLFLTDTLSGFFYRDVDGNGEVEIVHVENQVTPAGVEESYYTLYQLIDRRLERRSRTPVVERINELLSETRRLLLSGETASLLSKYATDPTLGISAYFELQEGLPIERVPEPEFVYVPELHSNPFDLRENQPSLRTEILLLSEGTENLYTLSLGLLVPPDGSPEIRILPTASSISF